MTLYSRKLLPTDKKTIESKKDDVSSCYMCYVCPDDCYLQPPPSSPPPPPLSQPAAASVPKHHISSVLILMLCVLGAVFLVFSYLTIRTYRYCRRRNSPSSMENRINSMRDDYFLGEDHGPDTAAVDHHIWHIRTIGLSQSMIDSIAAFEFRKGEGIIEGVDCSVCLNEFQENERLRLLPKCSHAFHVTCIDTWLRSHKNCPVCRAPVSIGSSNNSSNNNNMNVRLSDSIETNVSSSGEENRDESEARDETVENNQQENILLDDMVSRIEKFRVVSDLADRRAKIDQESEPMRRSVSLDFSCASMIYSDFTTKRHEGFSEHTKSGRNSEMIIAKRDCKNSLTKSTSSCSTSCGISMQNGVGSMKRSFSFSGKRSLRKKSISQESIPIRELAIYAKSQSINL